MKRLRLDLSLYCSVLNSKFNIAKYRKTLFRCNTTREKNCSDSNLYYSQVIIVLAICESSAKKAWQVFCVVGANLI